MNQPLRWDLFGSIGGEGFARESSALMFFLCEASTDHLGNVRAVLTAAGVIEQENEFYPYGESIDTGTQFTSDNPYKWGSKEWDADQGAYDFGARMYSPTDACWSTMDPLCEKYYHISPYAYCAGNPVNLVDPDGRSWYYSSADGSFVSFIDDGDDFVYMLSQEQINEANGEQEVLQSYKNDGILFGTLAYEGQIDQIVARNVISDFFDRANKKQENGQTSIINKPEIIVKMDGDVLGEEASSTSNVLNVNLSSGGYYRGYDIINLFAHEIGHSIHRKEVNKTKFKNLPEGVREIYADEYSISHWSYDKTSNYRKVKIKEHMQMYK